MAKGRPSQPLRLTSQGPVEEGDRDPRLGPRGSHPVRLYGVPPLWVEISDPAV